jgi:two-component system sensor histidine kinase AlgZ
MSRSKELIRFLIVILTIALIPPFLVIAIVRDVTLHQLLINYRFSLIYSFCIGGLSFAVIPSIWVAVRPLRAWQRWPLRIAAMFATTCIGGMAACLVFVALGWIPLGDYWTEFTASLRIATFMTVMVGGGFATYETLRWRLKDATLQLRTKELERERALKLATEAQLASLESRIHPHFLFNTLNSISSLIPEDPQRAERLLEQMAALLRFSLDANQSGLVPLASELKIVADYLEIERARFGERLRYRIDAASDTNGAQVPPLSVQTLVENSVKYAIAPNRAGGEIRIAGTRENGRLRVEVSDDGPGFTLESAPPGHGLDNLKGRLATLFGQQAALTLERHENRNSVMLTVPQAGDGHESISG